MKYIRLGMNMPAWPLGIMPDSCIRPIPRAAPISSRARTSERSFHVAIGKEPLMALTRSRSVVEEAVSVQPSEGVSIVTLSVDGPVQVSAILANPVWSQAAPK